MSVNYDVTMKWCALTIRVPDGLDRRSYAIAQVENLSINKGIPRLGNLVINEKGLEGVCPGCMAEFKLPLLSIKGNDMKVPCGCDHYMIYYPGDALTKMVEEAVSCHRCGTTADDLDERGYCSNCLASMGLLVSPTKKSPGCLMCGSTADLSPRGYCQYCVAKRVDKTTNTESQPSFQGQRQLGQGR